MLKNCVNKLPRKTQAAMQDSDTENCSQRYSSNYVSITFADEKQPQNNWLYAAAATKRLYSKILSHIINVQSQSLMMLVAKSISVYTSLIIV